MNMVGDAEQERFQEYLAQSPSKLTFTEALSFVCEAALTDLIAREARIKALEEALEDRAPAKDHGIEPIKNPTS